MAIPLEDLALLVEAVRSCKVSFVAQTSKDQFLAQQVSLASMALQAFRIETPLS